MWIRTKLGLYVQTRKTNAKIRDKETLGNMWSSL